MPLARSTALAAGVLACLTGGHSLPPERLFARLPGVGAEKIDLAVNLKTAEQLGVTVPRKILLRADAFRR